MKSHIFENYTVSEEHSSFLNMPKNVAFFIESSWYLKISGEKLNIFSEGGSAYLWITNYVTYFQNHHNVNFNKNF